MTRFCKKCNAETERSKRGDCKLCVNRRRDAWEAANVEKVKAYAAVYRDKNRDSAKVYAAEYYARNREQLGAKNKAWRVANYEKDRSNRAAYHAANRGRVISRVAAWRVGNPARASANAAIYCQNRRARKVANGGKLSRGLAKKLYVLQRGLCPCCSEPLGDNYHLDHIMPLALGGANEDWNIQLLRAGCNIRKSNKHPVDFMRSRGFLL